MATCEYERQREQRIADNRRRMEEMGIFTVCADALFSPKKGPVLAIGPEGMHVMQSAGSLSDRL